MVGRGLRLPYGERTGDKDVDAVMLTAHDKFQDILAEAQKGDSIFKAGNVIQAEEELDEPEEIVYTQLSLDIDQNESRLMCKRDCQQAKKTTFCCKRQKPICKWKR